MISAPPTRSSRAATWPSLGQLWAFLAVALPALAALLVPMPAVDLTYHLRAGAQILDGGGIPNVDTWTFTVAGQPWLDQQWGAQVLLAAVYKAGSWTGLALLRALLVATTFGLLLLAVRSAWSSASIRAGGSAIASSSRTATLLVLGSFAVAAPALALRPQLFAIVLFAATLLILAQRAAHPRRLWLIPFIAAAWANLHGSFPLVLVLVALAWLDEVSHLREPTPAGSPRRPLPQRLLGSTGVALIGAFAALATLATPFGIDGWRYIANLASNPAISSMVSEWRPPSPFDPAGLVFFVSLLAAAGIVAFRLRSDDRQLRARFAAPFMTLAAFGVLGIVTGRGLAWWALVLPVSIVALQPGLRLADVRLRGVPQIRARTAREASASEARRSPLNGAVVAILVLASVALLPLWRPAGAAGVPAATLSHAPQGIAAELRRLAADTATTGAGPLNVWTPQPWGSWLEFAVPEVKVNIDSRIELFSRDLISQSNQVTNDVGEWTSILLDAYPVDVVLVPATSDLAVAERLRTPFWNEVYVDADGRMFRRTDTPAPR